MARRTKKAGTPRDQPSAREELLKSARRLFAAKGFEGVSLKELEKQSGHNAALVSYYFASKEGLFRECVLPIFGAGTEDAALTLRSARSREEFVTRFELFVERFVDTHLREQDVCVILHRDLHTEAVKQLFKEHVHPLDKHLLRFLKAARKKGIVRSDIEPALLAKLIISSLFHLISLEPFRAELEEPTFLDTKKRDATVNQITRLFMGGFLTREP